MNESNAVSSGLCHYVFECEQITLDLGGDRVVLELTVFLLADDFELDLEPVLGLLLNEDLVPGLVLKDLESTKLRLDIVLDPLYGGFGRPTIDLEELLALEAVGEAVNSCDVLRVAIVIVLIFHGLVNKLPLVSARSLGLLL